ncbi:winged helix-turn-helix domain-containing protein [Streptomyces sp. NPDC001351]|uniref:winged helix-turn-helix domain-containing protein n=1 Tax=Streptomyces sp. NPDC001351 TaxID=3364564 RepID=UPI0036B68E96
MRHAQDGGLTAERRELHRHIRYEPGERFTRGEKTAVTARDLRVSERPVQRCRRAWRESGTDAPASAGPSKLPKPCDGQFAELEKELTLAPAEHGREDQRWTAARTRAVTAVRFKTHCSMAAVWQLPHRHGWSWQSPARRALQHDEHADGPRKNNVGPQVERLPRHPEPSPSSTTTPGSRRHPRPPAPGAGADTRPSCGFETAPDATGRSRRCAATRRASPPG